MPIILDRLPLPNIGWYSAISLFCLLCSVYYAGVQVKLHPDWKEQLRLRQAAAASAKESEPPAQFSLFEKELDDFGQCFDGDRNRSFSEEISSFNSVLCSREYFHDVINSAVYSPCYVRYDPENVRFRQYIFYNAYRLSNEMSAYRPHEYFQICRKWYDKIVIKNSELSSSNPVNENTNKHVEVDSVQEEETAVNRCETWTLYFLYQSIVMNLPEKKNIVAN